MPLSKMRGSKWPNQKFYTYGFRLSGMTLGLCLSLFAVPHAQAEYNPLLQDMAGHKAVYEISLAKAKPGVQVVGISGQVAYEIKHDCLGWNTRFDFDMEYTYISQAPLRVRSTITSYENMGDWSYNYHLERKAKGTVIDGRKGYAIRKEGGLHVNEEQPEQKESVFDLPVLFPMAHTHEIIQKAKQGKRFFSADIFDGFDDTGVMNVNTVITPLDDRMAYNRGDAVAALKGDDHEYWRVSLGYFPRDNHDEAQSIYEMRATLYGNGVLDDILLNYHDYEISQELKSIEYLPEQQCE